METHRLRIREQYLDLIRTGIKRNEYRLATSERKQIKIDDILILISNQDRSNYVKVIVKNIKYFPNWEEALSINWIYDFQGIYSTFDSVIHECKKFYSQDDVRKYGIEVFEIELFSSELKNSNILLDTNIVIHRESSNNIAYEVIQLYKSLDKLKVNKYILEEIKEELKKYNNKTIVENMLAKMEAYNCLQSAAINDDFFIKTLSKYATDDNSKIDNLFLYQIYKGRVDFFITDDKGILSKAKDLYLSDCVFSTNDFLSLVEKKYPSLIPYKVLSVNLCKISSLAIEDCFFDSLRDDYGGIKFNKWFNKKAKEGEEAYVFKNDKGLQGFLYLKIENEQEDYSDIEPIFSPLRRLKIGTFKINSTGLRIGERFLKIVFDYALKSNVEEIYVTLFQNKRTEVNLLMKLMMEWGFEIYGHKKSNGELVLVKKMGIYRNEKNPKFNFPNLKKNMKYGILPIDSQFHTDLFPDLYLKNENMTLFEEKPCGYAVEKIYVCRTKFLPVKPGDLMAVYRMSERFYKKYYSVVSGICILEEVLHPNNFQDFLNVCKNRSVFSEEQLNEFYNQNNYRTIIKVLFLKPLNNKITLNDLYANNIIDETRGPRLTTEISKEKFEKLLELGGVAL